MRGRFDVLWKGTIWHIATKTNNFIGIEIVGQSKRPLTGSYGPCPPQFHTTLNK